MKSTTNDPADLNKSQADKAGPMDARTKDNPIGVDDIGLEGGIQPDDVSKLADVTPDPSKTTGTQKQ